MIFLELDSERVPRFRNPVLKETLKVIWPNLHIFQKKKPDPKVKELSQGHTEADLDPYLVTSSAAGFDHLVLCPPHTKAGHSRGHMLELGSQPGFLLLMNSKTLEKLFNPSVEDGNTVSLIRWL